MITNKTTNQVISRNEVLCKNIFAQARGLMFRNKQNLIMIFNKEKKISLHMIFVFYPIDVLILDKNFKVIEIKEKFLPYKFWSSKTRGKYLIELGNKNGDVKVNDYLTISHLQRTLT